MHKIAVLAVLLSAGCAGWPQSSASTPTPPSSAELGRLGFRITTCSAQAQELFLQGLGWCYGFHHEEALRCFAAAAAADPGCAMAQWGLAYAAGPHINNMAMTEVAAKQAHEAAARGLALAAEASPKERALLAAIARRYVVPPPEDRSELDRDYAEAMREVYATFGDDPDVAALFAESLMNLRPWDLWQPDGSPQPGTPEILTVLERLLLAHPEHPQANHLYIHAVEASPNPERALAAAERLGGLAPAAGHLVHMPSHIFIRTGRYEEAAAANRSAIEVDHRIVARTGRSGFYELYRAHNFHFLVYAAMFAGRDAEAIATADQLAKELPEEVVKAVPGFLEGFLSVPIHARVRFGRWDELLAWPEPPAWQLGTRAVWHYGRGVALASRGDAEAAAKELASYEAACAEVPESWSIGNNTARAVLAIGRDFLEGEIAYRKGDPISAFAALRRATARSDELRYDEPWSWMMPPRHALGALLLESGQDTTAAAVYREDLLIHPENGWALHGLAEAQRRLGQEADAAKTAARFAAAWRHATVAIRASCFCRRG